ncbi:MAG: ABC transporter ATP-binding protein [Lachnospiraceae bacterium]|nr:ABC transporter ATP-binding protein [Lachnospiraceae bacterium]
MLKIDGVNKSFGKVKALAEIDAMWGNGVHGLLGENGAGKTTLLRIIATIMEPDSGNLSFDGTLWTDKIKARYMLGYLPQRFSMYRQIKVREALEHIGILKGVNENLAQEVDRVLEAVNLKDKCEKKVGTLSGGMVRRLGIAQALIGKPKIVLLDEPTAGLDPEERILFRTMIRELGKQCIVLLSTHIVEDVELTCDTVMILHKGRVITSGEIDYVRDAAKGRVWELCFLNDSDKSINHSWIVTQKKKEDGIEKIRILSEKSPCEEAICVAPSLEESYMWLIDEGERHEAFKTINL